MTKYIIKYPDKSYLWESLSDTKKECLRWYSRNGRWVWSFAKKEGYAVVKIKIQEVIK